MLIELLTLLTLAAVVSGALVLYYNVRDATPPQSYGLRPTRAEVLAARGYVQRPGRRVSDLYMGTPGAFA